MTMRKVHDLGATGLIFRDRVYRNFKMLHFALYDWTFPIPCHFFYDTNYQMVDQRFSTLKNLCYNITGLLQNCGKQRIGNEPVSGVSH